MKDEERKTVKEELKKKVDEMSDEQLDRIAGGMNVLEEFKKEMDEAAKEMMEAMKMPCQTCGTAMIIKEKDGKRYLCCETCNKEYEIPNF